MFTTEEEPNAVCKLPDRQSSSTLPFYIAGCETLRTGGAGERGRTGAVHGARVSRIRVGRESTEVHAGKGDRPRGGTAKRDETTRARTPRLGHPRLAGWTHSPRARDTADQNPAVRS